MKQFGSLMLAAVLGSVITVAITGYVQNENGAVRIEHVSGIPAQRVGFTVNEKGEAAPLDFTGTAEKVTAAVVHIRSTSQGTVSSRNGNENDPWQFFFGPQGPTQRGPSQSSGSGVIVNENGFIVTNNHVVDGADVVDVILSNNRTYRAEVMGTDPDTDLALIKINQKDLPHLSFVDSDQVKVGEWVLAVGNPFNLTSTVTAGIISAKGRNIGIINSGNRQDPQGSRTAIESFIQTDAAINPGNSGGALVNLNGDLIGINTAIASTTGAYAGYGFAVPSNIASKVVEDLLAYGTVQRGWLGISVGTVTEDLVKERDLKISDGAYVSGFGDVENISAAKQAGIRAGDVIVKLDETEIMSSTALIAYIGRKRPGDKVNVTVNRDGKTLMIPVTLKNRKGNLNAVTREINDSAALGIEFEDMQSRELSKLDLKTGVRVKELGNGKVSRSTDMRKGFIVTHIDSHPVSSVKEANELIKKKKEGETILFSGVYENYPREYIYAMRM